MKKKHLALTLITALMMILLLAACGGSSAPDKHEIGVPDGYATAQDDLGADSLDIFQIIMGIEETFDIEIDNDEADNISTVGDAVEQIKKATNN